MKGAKVNSNEKTTPFEMGKKYNNNYNIKKIESRISEWLIIFFFFFFFLLRFLFLSFNILMEF